ncbi:uncharacterized protein LOC134705557 [Mytilus trossulus]|uniref:uncharacterized protein LOC134705557 n=1 Tax=Mytilus trossulus TaxID=6551 RepID=UPI0030049686
MEHLLLYRIVVLVLLIAGFVLCFLSLILPYWIRFNTDFVSGYQGLFFICIYNHGGSVPCSNIMDSKLNVYGSYKIPQVFMSIGFSFYFICVVLASLTFFWTRDLKKIRGIKFAAASFAFLTAICLVVAVVVFHNYHDKETKTITYGWYIAVISLGCVTLACPCYIVDGCHTIKQKDEKVSTTNTAPCPTALTVYERQKLIDGFNSPCPTALTVYQRQKLIDGFNDQMSKQQSQLPEPLGLKGKFAVLYGVTTLELPPPRPITTDDSDDDTYKLRPMKTLKQAMVVPPVSGYSFKTINDYDNNEESFVHPPPKIVSSDSPLKDILRRNLQTHSGYDSDVSRQSSCYSLESGQIDDSDLEIYLLTKGSRSNMGSDKDRPPSREAFGKRKIKTKHKVSSRIVDGKNVTDIAHEGLPTIHIIGPDRESSDYKEPNPLGSSSALPREDEVLLPSEAENDDDTYYKANKKSASTRLSRRHKQEHDNEAYAKSDDEIYRARYGTRSPYTEKKDAHREMGEYDDKPQKSRKKSSKSKKHRSRKERREGESPMSLRDVNTTKEDKSNKSTAKGDDVYNKGVEVSTGLPKENTNYSDQTVDRSSKRIDQSENRHVEKSEEQVFEKKKYDKHDADRTKSHDQLYDDEGNKITYNQKNDKKTKKRHSSKKKHTKPYVGTNLTYDKVDTDLVNGGCDHTAQIQQDETFALVEQILKIE